MSTTPLKLTALRLLTADANVDTPSDFIPDRLDINDLILYAAVIEFVTAEESIPATLSD